MKYWMVGISKADFTHDCESVGLKLQGFSLRYKSTLQRMAIRDRVVYYITGLQRFGAIATITGDYFEDNTKVWTDSSEMWPARRPSEPYLVLQDEELVDVKKLVPELNHRRDKQDRTRTRGDAANLA